MKTFKKVAIALAITVGMTGCVVTPTVVGVNDPLEKYVTVNTRDFDKPYMIMYDRHDSFFIVRFDKATGNRHISLYIITRTPSGRGTSSVSPRWDRATTLVNKVAVDMKVNVVDTSFSCYQGSCTALTDARMRISEAILDEWDKGGIIRLKSATSNLRRDVTISAAEVAHLRVEMGKINM